METRTVAADTPGVLALVDALTQELAEGGYPAEQTFGYSPAQLRSSGVHLVGTFADEELVGIAGVELQEQGYAELKRFYVVPEHRGSEVARLLLTTLIGHARSNGRDRLRLETGNRQVAALAFYRRHGFVDVPRFGPYVDSDTSVCLQLDLEGP